MNVNSAGNPMLESLDCPVPSVKTPKRPSTTTALQALSLMNNEFANRMARLSPNAWRARRVRKSGRASSGLWIGSVADADGGRVEAEPGPGRAPRSGDAMLGAVQYERVSLC